MKVPAGYTGHVRDLVKGQVVPEPNVVVGHLRVLRRVDGLFVLFDRSLPLGETADGSKLFVSLEAATARAHELAGPTADARKT